GIMNALVSIPARKLLGSAHEARFERIMDRTRHRNFPDWFYGVRRASEDQDLRQGFDFVAELDVVEVTLQIKSSVAGREHHNEVQHRKCGTGRYMVPTVIVCEFFSDETVRAQTLRILDEERSRFFRGPDRYRRETRR
ncbi:MAG TPA: hypothetical protein VEA36_01955, partial [Candidatus Paceibacterota bacterium]|nr:hypothetical protein [Candidatus Paceibacterota bacterium]